MGRADQRGAKGRAGSEFFSERLHDLNSDRDEKTRKRYGGSESDSHFPAPTGAIPIIDHLSVPLGSNEQMW
jgi:hypothetical protein